MVWCSPNIITNSTALASGWAAGRVCGRAGGERGGDAPGLLRLDVVVEARMGVQQPLRARPFSGDPFVEHAQESIDVPAVQAGVPEPLAGHGEEVASDVGRLDALELVAVNYVAFF